MGSRLSILVLVLALALAGCTSTFVSNVASTFSSAFSLNDGVAPENIDALLDDDLFLEDSGPLLSNPVALYELPEDLARELDREIRPLPTDEQRYRALRRWIFDKAGNYEYDPGVTAAISELAEVGKINCFSFSVLYVAAARHLGLTADVQLVYSPPSWDMSESTWVLNQHINVSGEVRRSSGLQRNRVQVQIGTHTTRPEQSIIKYVVDLNPNLIVNVHRTERLRDDQVLARFYGNRAAEALVNGDYALAYAYSRRGLEADERSSQVLTNLGVLYARVDRSDLARQAYLAALHADSDADSARNNLVLIYRREGEVEEAERLERRIQARRSKNPYYHYVVGRQEADSGAYEQAIGSFKRAIRRKRNEPMFYVSLADAQTALGLEQDALETLQRGRRYADGENMALFE